MYTNDIPYENGNLWVGKIFSFASVRTSGANLSPPDTFCDPQKYHKVQWSNSYFFTVLLFEEFSILTDKPVGSGRAKMYLHLVSNI